MRPIVIVQHEADTGPGRFESYIQHQQLAHQTIRVFAGDPIPASAEAYAGICSLGGSMSANDDLPWIEPELALMRDADKRGVPIIGHCLGGQLLAKAFGASVTRAAMKEIGWGTVAVEDPALAHEWIGSEPSFELFQWHEDSFGIPADGRRFLTSQFCANQAFVIERKPHAHLGMQFHIEMTPQLVTCWTSDPNGVREIDEAFRRQRGAGVQRCDEIVRELEPRTRQLSHYADRIYQRWLRGLRR